MPAGRCLVCERSGSWAAAWRERLPPGAPRLIECRLWSEVETHLGEAPASLVCLEARGVPAAEFVSRLATLARHYPLARAIVLADPTTAPAAWAWWDVGVAAVALGPWDLDAVTPVLTRHFAQGVEWDESWRTAWWRRLPWQAATSGTSNS